jgi:arabinogalactan endo-1,4-beta-galactosidase
MKASRFHSVSVSTRVVVLLTIFLNVMWRHSVQAADYIIGADLSFLKQAEERGAVFKENGQKKPGLQIFKDHGYNWIRLRLFHTPPQLPNNLEYTIAQAKEAKKLGFQFLLNFHYSDTWADPAKQFIPKAWEGKSHEELVQAVFEYTRDTMRAFREAGAYPDMVQVGNEVISGMLWPDGKLPGNWDNFVELVKAGIRGIDAERGERPRPKIMIHIDRGGDKDGTKYFFDRLNSYHLDYDIMGQSYYAWWHGVVRLPRQHALHGEHLQQGHSCGGSCLLLETYRIQDDQGAVSRNSRRPTTVTGRGQPDCDEHTPW